MNKKTPKDIYSVSRLTGEVRIALDVSFPTKVWIEAEISNLARPASGHLYFSLKDKMSQVRCAMFRMKANRINFTPENGDQVLVHAKISLYEPRGDFQLVVEHMEIAGEGALLRAFEQLKQKLANEGIFDESTKKPLPPFPRAIGIVTSPSGAAIRDILSIIKRRFPAMPLIIYPTSVQGTDATVQIINAIEVANHRQECDVLIIARGGGSLEDLWCFNEEAVARAIHSSQIPTISGVGHETDLSIADLAADHRAATPSAAAELATPVAAKLMQNLQTKEQRLTHYVKQIIRNNQQSLSHLTTRLQQQHPKNQLEQKNQRIDELERRLLNALQRLNKNKHIQLSELTSQLYRHSPQHTLTRLSTRQQLLNYRLKQAINQHISTKRQQLAASVNTLEAISPLATLSRGYGIVTHSKTNKALLNAMDVKVGDTVSAKLHKGKLVCTVKERELSS